MKVFDEPLKKLEEAEEAGTERQLLMLHRICRDSRHLPPELIERILANVPNSVALQEAAGNGRDI